jgi:hypothetical protein
MEEFVARMMHACIVHALYDFVFFIVMSFRDLF